MRVGGSEAPGDGDGWGDMARRRMTRRPGLGHGLMVLSGLVTFVLVAGVLRADDDLVEVLVAEADLAVGTPTDEIPVSPVGVPAATARRLGLVGPHDLDGPLTIQRPVLRGEALRSSDLAEPSGVRPGRTMVVPVERNVVEGLGLRVGDRVDLIAVAGDGRSRYALVGAEVIRLPGPRDTGALGRSVEAAAQWVALGVADDQALDLAATVLGERLAVVRATGAPPPTVLERSVARSTRAEAEG
jgi:hypothetical protein